MIRLHTCRRGRVAGVWALVLALVVALSGCAASVDAPAGAPASPTAEIRIGLGEWSIHTGGAVPRPGEVTFVVTNSGGTVHDLVVHGEDGSWRTPMLRPGERHTMTITARPGEVLHLDCSVPGHHEQGMHTTMEVADEPEDGSGG